MYGYVGLLLMLLVQYICRLAAIYLSYELALFGVARLLQGISHFNNGEHA